MLHTHAAFFHNLCGMAFSLDLEGPVSLDIHLTVSIKWCIPYDAQITYKHKRQSFYVDNVILFLVVTWASAVLGSPHTDTGALPRTSDILLVPKLESLYRDPDFSLIYTWTQRWCQERWELASLSRPLSRSYCSGSVFLNMWI